jgi:hypothetical protein
MVYKKSLIMKQFKIGFLIIMIITMLYFTIVASLHQNLFTEFSKINTGPWFTATLVDFYINQFYLWLIPATLEKNIAMKLVWLVLMFFLGSMGTSLYFIIKIYQNKKLVIHQESL